MSITHTEAKGVKASTLRGEVPLCISALSLKLSFHASLMAFMLQTQHEPSEKPAYLLLAKLDFLPQ